MNYEATDVFEEIRILKGQRDALADCLREALAVLKVNQIDQLGCENIRAVLETLDTLEEQP